MPTRCPPVLLRAVTRDDDTYLRRLFAESRPDLAVLPPHLRDGLVDLQFRAQQTAYARHHPHAEHRVLVVDGENAGRLLLTVTDAEVRVVDITVAQQHRGRGVGTAALEQVIVRAGARPVRLSVWSDNTAARTLYARLGFTTTTTAVAGAAPGYLEMERKA